MNDDPLIYHIVPLSELRAGTRKGVYEPASLAEDGFVHCAAGVEIVLAVARDYFTGVAEPVMVLEVDVAKLVSRCVLEAPAPRAGGGREHLATAAEFPHVYGPLNLDAIAGAARLGVGDGRFDWPERFSPLDDWLDG